MNEILRGARYTFGALVVMTLWSISMALFVEWQWNWQVDSAIDKMNAYESALLKYGPGDMSTPEDVRRYHEMVEASE